MKQITLTAKQATKIKALIQNAQDLLERYYDDNRLGLGFTKLETALEELGSVELPSELQPIDLDGVSK